MFGRVTASQIAFAFKSAKENARNRRGLLVRRVI
jgi:hypothetical protein